MPRSIPWWLGGVFMSLLFLYSFSSFGASRPIGASTGMSYLADILVGFDANNSMYVQEIEESGAWEGVMLLGALVGALFFSIFITKTFHLSFIPTLWKERKNNSILSRMIWSFVGGFLVMFGARMAGGCNVGHVLSGGSQLAVSGFVFTIIALSTGMIFGRFFYNKRSTK